MALVLFLAILVIWCPRRLLKASASHNTGLTACLPPFGAGRENFLPGNLRENNRQVKLKKTNNMYFRYYLLNRLFFWTFAQKIKVKKTGTHEFFAQNSKFRQFFQKFKKIFTQILQFSSKIRQNCSKTQEFTQNSR